MKGNGLGILDELERAHTVILERLVNEKIAYLQFQVYVLFGVCLFLFLLIGVILYLSYENNILAKDTSQMLSGMVGRDRMFNRARNDHL